MKKTITFLCAMLCMTYVWAADNTTSPFTGISVEDAAGRNDIFLYNVESGYFMQDNYRNWSIWTTGAQLGPQGMLLGIEDVGDGTYYINSPLNNGKMGWNGSAFYLDMSAGVAWTFSSKEDISNAYTIDNGTYFLHAAAENNVCSGGAKIGYQLQWDNAGVRNTWQIVTREERESYMIENATNSKPLDATFIVGMPNLPRNVYVGDGWGINGWTINRTDGQQYLTQNNLWDWNVYEFDNVTSLEISQPVAGAPVGKYRARFFLMYSPTAIADASEDLYNAWTEDGDEAVKAVAYVNDQEVKAASYYSQERTQVLAEGQYYSNDFALTKEINGKYFASNWDQAARRMYVGGFATEWIEFTVEEGSFDLGIKTIDGLDEASCIIFGGVEIEYMGDGVDDITSPFTGISVEEAAGRNDIFLYNVESGLWMQDNYRNWSYWTTGAQLANQGMLLGIEAVEDGTYYIKSPLNDGKLFFSGGYPYLDGGTGQPWTFTTKEGKVSNAYTIVSGNYCLHTADENNICSGGAKIGYQLQWDNNADRSVWQIVTREERENYLKENATKENPLDATFVAGMPNLPRNVTIGSGWGINGWTITRTDGEQNLQRNNLWDWNVYEFNNVSSLDVSQTVAGALEGRYRARFYLMYSPTAIADASEDLYNEWTEDGDETVKLVGYAGGKEVKAASYYSQELTQVQEEGQYYTNDFALTKEINGKFFASNWNQAARRMYVGGFMTDWIEFNAAEGTFDLCIKTIEGLDANSCIIFGGVEIEYIGECEEEITSPFTGISVEEAAGRNDIFLYNVESGYFMQDNTRNWNYWSTGAQLGTQGMLLGIEAMEGAETYYINTPLNNGKLFFSGGYPYLDGGTGQAWTFTAKEGEVSNAYTIVSGNYCLHAADENNICSGGAKIGYQLQWDNNTDRSVWQIVTREERENYLKENATEENPLDATFIVGMPNLPRNVTIGSGWGINGWTIYRTDGTQNLQRNNLWDWNVYEFDNVYTLEVTQPVTDALNGKYRARFALMYSPTAIADASEDLYDEWVDEGDETVKVIAYADDQEVKAASYYSQERTQVQEEGQYYTNDFALTKEINGKFFAADWNQAARRMYVGGFMTDWMEFTIDNGSFDLGIITTDDLDANSCIIFGGVEIEYMSETIETAIESINTTSPIKGDGKIYNLQGQRVNSPSKGVFIINGKKVVFK